MVEPVDGDPDLHYVGARIARTHPAFADFGPQYAGGCGTTEEAALASALCEGAERYAAGVYPPIGDPPVPRGDVRIPAVEPGACCQFSNEQWQRRGFPYTRPTADVPLRWTTGRDLATQEECAVPAFSVFLPYLPTGGEPLVGPGISTGLCCAESSAEALVGGICEVIERDASAMLWIKGMSPPQIDDQRVRDCAADLLPPADEVTAYDITTDLGIPVAFVVYTGWGVQGRLLSVGSACHPNASVALRKAVKEASQDRVYVRLLIEADPGWSPQPDFGNVVDFPQHARLYSGRPELAARAFACLEGNSSVSSFPDSGAASDVDAQRQRLTDALGSKSLEGAWVDLTPEWAERLGLRIVKVVIPGLLPLHGNHHFAYLGHARLGDPQGAMPSGEVRHHHPIWPFPHPSP